MTEDQEPDDDAEDAEEIQKLIKEEDINLMPENTDVSEIDKLTGVPKHKGKLLNQSTSLMFDTLL